jgi:hypothetical protein
MNHDNVVILKERTRSSVRNFIKKFLSLGETSHWFPERLTFKEPVTDPLRAKYYLNKFFYPLRDRFPDMPSIYVEEWQKDQGIQYQVVFMLFGKQKATPKDTLKELESEIIPRWKAITGGDIHRDTSWLAEPEKEILGLKYLLKGVVPANDTAKGQPLWHGTRLGYILNANSNKVSKQAVTDAMARISPKKARK